MAQGSGRGVFALVAALCVVVAVPAAAAAPAEPQPPAVDGLKTSWRAPAGKPVTDEITVMPAGTAFRIERRDQRRWRSVHEYASDAAGAVTVAFPTRLGVTTYRLVVPRTSLLTDGLVSDPVEVVGFRKRATVSGWDTAESFLTKGTHVRDEVRGTPSGATAYVQRRTCRGCEWRNVSRRVIPDDRRFVADLGKVRVGESKYDAADHVLLAIYPSPEHSGRYVVLNSGYDVRGDGFASNALQTPKFPDWAVIDLREPASARWPGKVVDAGFFDEAWR